MGGAKGTKFSGAFISFIFSPQCWISIYRLRLYSKRLSEIKRGATLAWLTGENREKGWGIVCFGENTCVFLVLFIECDWAGLPERGAPMVQFLLDVLANVLADVLVVIVVDRWFKNGDK
jgi:VanZ family protein